VVPVGDLTLSSGAALGPSATAADRIDDVVDAARQLQLGHLRFSVPWAAIEPRRGAIDGSVVEELRAAAEASRAVGISPWFLLLQPEVPPWFADDHGWSDAAVAGVEWPRWVERAAGLLGDVAAGWVPIEAPYAVAHREGAGDPRRTGEVLETLVVAWRDAWRILRGGGPLVATSLDVRAVRPADDRPESVDAARREERARWDLWLDGLADGVAAAPGRAERPLADLQGACDVLGVALSGDVERSLHRVGERAAGRPLAVTFRANGESAVDRRASVELMRRDVGGTADELRIGWSTVVATLPDDLALLAP
jgi:hypothetical protein